MAGYSGTPLPKKLGIKPGHRVTFLGAPAGFPDLLGTAPEGVTVVRGARGAHSVNVVVLFAKATAGLREACATAARALAYDGGLWVAWPKKSSGVKTDLTEHDVRTCGLALGLVDNKVCAIDETWSALRFVYRLKDRPRTGK